MRPTGLNPMSAALRSFLAETLQDVPSSFDQVFTRSRSKSLERGETLLSEGQHWKSVYWIEEGALRLYYLTSDGRSVNKNFYLEGALLWPITPSLQEYPVNFHIEALVGTKVWVTAWSDWRREARDWPAWQAHERRTLEMLLDQKLWREEYFLKYSAAERYRLLCSRHPNWVARIPLKHLASFIGVTDVALSRIRRRLNPG
jgi:hypothetical protein